MTITREERSQMLLAALGLEAWPSLLEELEALGPMKAIACFKTDTGYELVSAPSGANKKWQARTSGKPCGQRGLGSFTSAEAAAIEVFRWIVGIKPTPPTPGRIKSRSKRGEGKRQLDRCNHGRGAPFFTPSGRAHLSQLGPTLTGGPDLRTSEHRPSKAKRALESTGLPVLKQRPRPSAAFNLSSWPAEEELETLVCDAAQLQCLPGQEGPLVPGW